MERVRLYVTGHPHSGNTWLLRLLSDLLDAPLVSGPEKRLFGERDAGEFEVVKTHSLDKFGPTVFIFRDPRDVAVSAMFYRKQPDLMTTLQRMTSPVAGQFPDLPGRYEPFVRDWYHTGRAEIEISYEDLHERPLEALGDVVKALAGRELTPERIAHSLKRQEFKAVRARYPGEGLEHSMRKGIAGDWKNYFKQKEGQFITARLGGLMLEQGYVTSLDWWKELPA